VTDARDFRDISRRGRRGASRTLVAHLLSPAGDEASRAVPAQAPRAGFVVGKTVGNSVVRHRVVRRLRHQVQPLLRALPPGAAVVVRALPAAGTASSAELGRDLASCLQAAARSTR
jgi:ribonuclease P protein component